MSSRSNPFSAKLVKTGKIALVVIALGVSLYLLNFVPYVGTVLRFPLGIARCGKLPIMAEENDGLKLHYLPGSGLYQINNVAHGQFFCSEEEAKQAGYGVLAF